MGPHIGTVSLSGLRMVIMPKIRIDNLMRMVAYAFDLSDLTGDEDPHDLHSGGPWAHRSAGRCRSFARWSASHAAGLLPNYQARNEDLATPRGRLDMRHIATHPRRATLRCTYDDLTVGPLAEPGPRRGLAPRRPAVMQSVDLRLDLARAADRFFGDLTRIALNAEQPPRDGSSGSIGARATTGPRSRSLR